MHMTFWWSSVIENLLFRGYNIKTVGGLISTCFGLIALAVAFEWLKLLQARQRQKELLLRAQQIRSICPPSESASLLFSRSSNRSAETIDITLLDRILMFLWDSFVWFNLQIIGYILMLVVMVYNGWMMIALVLGSGLGYFLFGPSFMKINLQNCQAIRETFCVLNCDEPGPDGETTPALQASTSAISVSHTTRDQTSVCVHAPPLETT